MDSRAHKAPTVRDRERTGSSLHAQRILAHRLPPALVTSSHVLVQRKALGEPEGAVLTLAPGHHDHQDKDDQQKDRAGSQQRQQRHTRLQRLQRLSCRQETKDFSHSLDPPLGAPGPLWLPTSQAHPVRPTVGMGSPGAPPRTALPGSRPRSGRQGSSGHSRATAGTVGCQSPASPLSCGDRGGISWLSGAPTARLAPSPTSHPSARLRRAVSTHHVTMAHLPPSGIQPHHNPQTSFSEANRVPQTVAPMGTVFMATSLMAALGTGPDLPYQVAASASGLLKALASSSRSPPFSGELASLGKMGTLSLRKWHLSGEHLSDRLM